MRRHRVFYFVSDHGAKRRHCQLHGRYPISWDFPQSIAFRGQGDHLSAKPSRGEDWQIEAPVACWDTPAFHFHPALRGMLGATLRRDEVIQVCQPCEQRFLTAPWVMQPFHGEAFPLDGVVGLIA